MAAHEQQDERVVGGRRVVTGTGCGLWGLQGRGGLPGPARVLAADLVDQPPGGDGDQPAAGIGRHTVGRPAGGRGGRRLLHGVLGLLGLLGLTVAADEHAEVASVVLKSPDARRRT